MGNLAEMLVTQSKYCMQQESSAQSMEHQAVQSTTRWLKSRPFTPLCPSPHYHLMVSTPQDLDPWPSTTVLFLPPSLLPAWYDWWPWSLGFSWTDYYLSAVGRTAQSVACISEIHSWQQCKFPLCCHNLRESDSAIGRTSCLWVTDADQTPWLLLCRSGIATVKTC